MSNKNTLKHKRTIELPFNTEDGKSIDIKFSASREQVNEIRLLLGTNEENVKKNYYEIHNTLDWLAGLYLDF